MSRDSGRGQYSSPDGSAAWEYIAAVSCALMIFCVGCTAGWTAPTLAILMAPDSSISLTSSDASTLASTVALGHAMAPVFTMVMANKLGRKYSLLVSGIPSIISWGLILVTRNILVLFVARFIGGLTIGFAFCFPAMYLGEIASAKLRGMMGMVCGTMLNAGMLFMFVFVPYLSVQSMAWVSMSLATAAVISIWFIPESPYFLATVGKIDKAEYALEKLRGKTDVSEELELIKLTIKQKSETTEESSEGKASESSVFRQIFTVQGNRKALFITFLFCMVLQFGSYVIMMVYGRIIFDKMNTDISSHICMMIVATLQLICNILTAFVIERLGRRPLICISGVISGTCLLVIAAYFYLLEYTNIDVAPYSRIALFAVLSNILALNIGLTPLQHVVQSEIFDTKIKGLATCIIGIGGGILCTISVKLYLMVALTWNYGHCVPFFYLAVSTWIYTLLILKLLPETKGKTLLQIQQDLNA